MMMAGAMPPAAHIVTSPRLRLRRSSSSSTVPIRIEPVAPMGWPSAIEPPLTLTLSRSSLRSRMNFSATTANASLISNRSMSSSVRPALANTLRAAGTGAFSIRVGESPIFAIATTRARGFRPWSFCITRRRQQDCRRSVHNAGRIAGVMHEVDVEVGIFVEDELAIGRSPVVERIICNRRKRRLQAGQPFERGLRPRVFLAVEREAAILAKNRHEALVEMSTLDGSRRPLLAFEAELIDVLPRDAFQRRDCIGAD